MCMTLVLWFSCCILNENEKGPSKRSSYRFEGPGFAFDDFFSGIKGGGDLSNLPISEVKR